VTETVTRRRKLTLAAVFVVVVVVVVDEVKMWWQKANFHDVGGGPDQGQKLVASSLRLMLGDSKRLDWKLQ
jgi:succinyl-CoA synthetase beta subunit